jgi:hypothetical protein
LTSNRRRLKLKHHLARTFATPTPIERCRGMRASLDAAYGAWRRSAHAYDRFDNPRDFAAWRRLRHDGYLFDRDRPCARCGQRMTAAERRELAALYRRADNRASGAVT